MRRKKPSPPRADRTARPAPVSRRARLAPLLFPLYVLWYAGFVAFAAFSPERMAEPSPLESVNVALLYGMGLILAAMLLALLSVLWSRTRRSPPTEARLPPPRV